MSTEVTTAPEDLVIETKLVRAPVSQAQRLR